MEMDAKTLVGKVAEELAPKPVDPDPPADNGEGGGEETERLNAELRQKIARFEGARAEIERQRKEVEAELKELRKAKGKPQTTTGGMAPDGERYKFRFRDAHEHVHYLDEFTAAEIALDGGVEPFLRRRLEPKHGPGDYYWEFWPTNAKVPTQTGHVPLKDLRVSTPAAPGGPTIQDVERMRREAEEREQRRSEERLAEEKARQGDLASLVMRQADQQERIFREFREELREIRNQQTASQAAMPAGPPPDSGAETAKAIAEAMGGVFRSVGEIFAKTSQPPPPPQQMSYAEVLGLIREGTKDQLSAKDLLAMVPSVLDKVGDLVKSQSSGKSAIKEVLEGFEGLEKLKGKIGPRGNDFNDMLSMLFEQGLPNLKDFIKEARGAEAEKRGRTKKTTKEERPSAPKPPDLDYPAGWDEWAGKIARSSTDQERVINTLEGFAWLGGHHKGWAGYFHRALAHVQGGAKGKLMAIAHSFLQRLAADGQIPTDAIAPTMSALDKQWPQIREYVAARMRGEVPGKETEPEVDEEEGVEDDEEDAEVDEEEEGVEDDEEEEIEPPEGPPAQ